VAMSLQQPCRKSSKENTVSPPPSISSDSRFGVTPHHLVGSGERQEKFVFHARTLNRVVYRRGANRAGFHRYSLRSYQTTIMGTISDVPLLGKTT
jgi:hypothetical protein